MVRAANLQQKHKSCPPQLSNDWNVGPFTDGKIRAGQITEIYWSPLYEDYVGLGVGCSQYTLGYTMYAPLSITMCPLSWDDPKRKDSLSDCRTGVKTIKGGTSLKAAMSVPSTLLHELYHMTTLKDKSTKAPYYSTAL